MSRFVGFARLFHYLSAQGPRDHRGGCPFMPGRYRIINRGITVAVYCAHSAPIDDYEVRNPIAYAGMLYHTEAGLRFGTDDRILHAI
ncbi:uncharacterized protein PHACADRAFT_163744 [Phanerochaete carnosa HHB-10118-sp]|uniref:Uncharacterized protein n=1 Tax=Phanerochaete carnosa (strain HHB-10118-sp) TaxID=650164 RepID=K5WSP8_PHACS|nr:uncharacterized protein PHACADRAFT_163744 [Phanerochaete carnosa HHB-10118-sp]EKM53427.1 hypothetical protein PHACADRAFT_163744 [Phanerochaete carnosa HHB-10118-sp]